MLTPVRKLKVDDGSTDASIFNAHGTSANAVSWAPAVASSPALASQKRFASAGSDNLIKVWSYNEDTKKWFEEEVITGHADWVRDVAWAPNIGLPGTYIASASQVSPFTTLLILGSYGPYTHTHDAFYTMDNLTPSSQCPFFPRSSFLRCGLACQLVTRRQYTCC
jgi:WD40 repeat protein